MAYTWTDGELITAEKLNNTGGGAIEIIDVTAKNDNDIWTVENISLTFAEMANKIQQGVLLIARVSERLGDYPPSTMKIINCTSLYSTVDVYRIIWFTGIVPGTSSIGEDIAIKVTLSIPETGSATYNISQL